MANYKDYMQRILESQSIYKGTDQASPSVPGYENGGANLGAYPGADPFEAMSDDGVFDNPEQMMTTTDPDFYNIRKRTAQDIGPRISPEIQRIDSEIRKVYWSSQPYVQGNPILESKLDSFLKAQARLYQRWMIVLKGFRTYVEDLEVLLYQYESLLAEILKFNASL
jgi:hypothetical protein